MRFYADGQQITYTQACNHARADARQAGLDDAEFESIWQRACRDDADGEYARDELARFCSVIEITTLS